MKCAGLIARPDPKYPVLDNKGWRSPRALTASPRSLTSANRTSVSPPSAKGKTTPRGRGTFERALKAALSSSTLQEGPGSPTSTTDMSSPASPAMRSTGDNLHVKSSRKANSLDTSGLSTNASMESFPATGDPSSAGSPRPRPSASRSYFTSCATQTRLGKGRQVQNEEQRKAQRRASWVM